MSAKLDILRDRAEMLSRLRAFFHARGVLEVDCPALMRYPPLDANIEVIEAAVTDQEKGYLHTSPEYAMKRLIASGLNDIYYLGHVFRKGEIGRLHNPEFTMVEWYRTNVFYQNFIQETCDLIMLFLGELPISFLSYRDAFLSYVNIDPFADIDLRRVAKERPHGCDEWDRDTWLHFFLSHYIEPQLGRYELTVLYGYPPNQAALARIIEDKGEKIAERFEIYHEGVELSNGYHELSDAKEQRRRFMNENQNRLELGKEPYPLDETFLQSLATLPDCCGVSVGFDRLMLLRHRKSSIEEVMPFGWT